MFAKKKSSRLKVEEPKVEEPTWEEMQEWMKNVELEIARIKYNLRLA